MGTWWSHLYYGITSDAIIDGILREYGSNSTLWDRMVTGQSSYEEIMTAYNNIPDVSITRALNGSILGIDAKQAVNASGNSNINTLLGSVDSNAQSATYGATASVVVDIPSNTTVIQPDPQLDPEYGVASGPLSGSGNPIAAIADRASLAVTGISLGAKLGKAIDQTLYDLDPDWWDEHLPTINPETWSGLVGVNPAGDFFLRTFLGVDANTGKMTSYYNEMALAYYYQMLRDNGAYDSPDSYEDISASTKSALIQPSSWGNSIYVLPPGSTVNIISNDNKIFQFTAGSGIYTVPFVSSQSYPNGVRFYFVAKESGHTITTTTGIASNPSTTTQTLTATITRNGLTYYYATFADDFQQSVSVLGMPARNPYTNYRNIAWDIGYIVFHGEVVTPSTIEGMSDISGATQYPPTNITGTTPSEVLQQLKQEYPDLFNDAIKIRTLQDDGTIKEDTYIPVPTPDIDSLDMNQPVSGDVTQDNTDISDETLTKIFNDKSNKNPTDTDTPDTGTGTGPTVTIPTGNASSLWAVYNPSQSQLNSFGSWLWSSDLVDQIKRLFVDPMQAVIGVHKVFCNVPNGGSATIKCGYIDSGVSAPTVSSQYVQIDCGTVSVNEFYGNVFDYEPYTTIHAYLPFIGVVKLDTGDVMRGSVNITYGVDVITGACLAKIKVSRDGNSGILYSFGGSCAVHYPLSSGSYGGIISGIVSAAVGVGTSVITGNPLAAVGGIVSGAHQAHFDVSKSGGFTGASGATGPKKPYLIISRPQTSMARGFDVMTGYPANQLVQVKDCEGFIKCKETHIESSTATQEELNTIETMLKNGILI